MKSRLRIYSLVFDSAVLVKVNLIHGAFAINKGP